MTKAQQRLGLLQSEIQGLDAAVGESQRHERAATNEADQARRHALFDDALAASKAFRVLVSELDAALSKVGDIRQRLDARVAEGGEAFTDAVDGIGLMPALIPLRQNVVELFVLALMQHRGVVAIGLSGEDMHTAADGLRSRAEQFDELVERMRHEVIGDEKAAA